MSTSWDVGSVYFTGGPTQQPDESTPDAVQSRFLHFLREFRQDSAYIYRDQLKNNLMIPEYSLSVDMRHLQAADPTLCHQVIQSPTEMLPIFESATLDLASDLLNSSNAASLPDLNISEIQVLLKSDSLITPMRQINSDSINRLVRISGIVSSASTPTSRATRLHLFCRNCRHSKVVKVNKGFSPALIPRVCENAQESRDGGRDCPMDPYMVDHEKTKQVDQQILKLQESPDSVPVGELPRHVLLTVDRHLTNRVFPGARITVTGVYDVFQKQSKTSGKGGEAQSIRNPYIRVLGMEVDLDAASRGKRIFTPEEEAKYIALARRPDIYQAFSSSIAPSIYGNEDIKKSIACLLMGGSKKILPDGMRLRGDINVLLLGDPGTAKSQLLKFVEKVSPVSVYTSGKGSSAAGLTASVIRDSMTGEFYLEGGAMVLADGGVVCIDEFDKMREEDRVAIHEAMEQQTISIAKAGITTILNSRTSVLAAANPIFGRYDEMKTPGENIDFQTTILSRFDMIYILRDEHVKDRDEALAKHVLAVHASGSRVAPSSTDIDVNDMKGFISYCKSKCAPRLSPDAREKLASHFVDIRSQIQKFESETNARSSVPITIRQLEAIVRISESLAKLSLSPVVLEHHVDEAIRLFRVSTYAATRSGYVVGENMMMGSFKKEVVKAQEELRRRLPIGSRMNETALLDFLRRKQFSEYAVRRAMSLLQSRGAITYTNQGHTVIRTGV